MDRAQLLALIDVANARGLEIGALNRPVIQRSMGPVEYVDRAPREALQRWYAGDPAVDADAIVEVDHVWGEQTLLQSVGGARAYHYVVASHVIEHVPDVFGWLQEIAAVLADGGLACFFAPDKRFTFDIIRRTSSESELVDAYVRRLRRPDTRQLFDHFHGFRHLESPEILAGAAPQDLPSAHSPRELLELCQRVRESGEYVDAHCWVFTPRAMARALDLASRLDLLPFEIAALEPTPAGSNEFFVALRRLPDGLTAEARRAAFVDSHARLDLPEDEVAVAEAERLRTRAAFAEERLAAIEASTSWRLTAPLRRAMALLRRGRDRPDATTSS